MIKQTKTVRQSEYAHTGLSGTTSSQFSRRTVFVKKGKELIMSEMPIMYNSRKKMEYIKHESTNSKVLVNYFARIAKKEMEYHKDVINMTYQELRDTIESLTIRRSDTRAHLISALRGYANWAQRRISRTLKRRRNSEKLSKIIKKARKYL